MRIFKAIIIYLTITGSLFMPISLNRPPSDGFKPMDASQTALISKDGLVALKELEIKPITNRDWGRMYVTREGWSNDQWVCLEQLWTNESNWRTEAHNTSSGAHGIPQALPASKMSIIAADYLTSPETQVRWGILYIRDNYHTPCNALAFWNSHSPHWY